MKVLNSTLKQYEDQFQTNENDQNEDLASSLVMLEEERQRLARIPFYMTYYINERDFKETN